MGNRLVGHLTLRSMNCWAMPAKWSRSNRSASASLLPENIQSWTLAHDRLGYAEITERLNSDLERYALVEFGQHPVQPTPTPNSSKRSLLVGARGKCGVPPAVKRAPGSV